MPVQTGELREFAIKNELFVLNLNKRQGTSIAGQNTALLKEILAGWNRMHLSTDGNRE